MLMSCERLEDFKTVNPSIQVKQKLIFMFESHPEFQPRSNLLYNLFLTFFSNIFVLLQVLTLILLRLKYFY